MHTRTDIFRITTTRANSEPGYWENGFKNQRVLAYGIRKMKISELLQHSTRRSFSAVPEMNALTEFDALIEASIIKMHFDYVLRTVWYIIDCKGALEIRAGNTALLAIHDIERFSWRNQVERSPRLNWTILDWRPIASPSNWQLNAMTLPSGDLELVGKSAEFFVGDVPGCDDAPPDFTTSTDQEIFEGLADWSSEFEPIYASFYPSNDYDAPLPPR